MQMLQRRASPNGRIRVVSWHQTYESHTQYFTYNLNTLLGMLGLPLLCAGIVPSMSHLNALSVYSKTYAPGEKARLEHVLEQRITAP